ncbi:cobalt-precorrin-6A reductase [Paenirhodobacter sp.]|uniref:cobalt-precorrin-6A reductase n=1 Tax=Paenirhodobacter sp. TaxID=1965326 RepID=UPI003B3E6747
MTTLILGGTTEASRLASALAEAGLPAVLSYAGRTESPRAQPVPVRIGGFGGVGGLAAYLRHAGIRRVVDATHPFAAQISRNAVAACALAGVPLIALERPAWEARAGDRWTHVPDIAAAVAALHGPAETVFLAIGRQHLAEFAGLPHRFLLRLVDPPQALPLADAVVEVARGPFDVAGDRALMQRHGVGRIVAKNAGGAGAEAKLIAARDLGLPVILIDRPALPERRVVATVAEVMGWLHADLGV